MEALTQLRKLARERRDKAITQANVHYLDTVKRIAAIEQDLLGHNTSTHKRLSACIQQAIPVDRPFTISELWAILEGTQPDRIWRERTITLVIGRLRRAGYVKRLRRPTGKQPALYVRATANVQLPVEAQTLAGAAESILRHRHLTLTELAVVLRESGYQTRMGNKALRAALGTAMRGKPKRFREVGRRWELHKARINLNDTIV